MANAFLIGDDESIEGNKTVVDGLGDGVSMVMGIIFITCSRQEVIKDRNGSYISNLLNLSTGKDVDVFAVENCMHLIKVF